MLRILTENLNRGVLFVKNNPQILYTIFLLIVIPLAFFFTGQKFLSVASENQDRLERNRIALMHDVFVGFAAPRLDDAEFLQDQIDGLIAQNETITSFRVVRIDEHIPIVVASMIPEEIGENYSTEDFLLKLANAEKGSSVFSMEFDNDGRQWRALRSILDPEGEVLGYVTTNISMAHVDKIVEDNIRSAYLWLFVIIVLIFILLVRQAKIIDYAVLYRRLKEVDQLKDDFISMAAHELRTPLFVIRGYVELLEEISGLTDKDKENLRRIDVSAQQLNGLVGDILDVSRLQQGRMQFNYQNIDPNEVIGDVIATLRHRAEERGLALIYEARTLPHISVDPDRLRQVMVNIIGNSVKYTPFGHIEITVKEEAKDLVIRISDTGLGMSAEQQKNLFQKFYRVKTKETRDIPGTGLGLWITQKIVHEMSGEISVESIQGKGTDFIVSFPLATEGAV